ncbi:TRAPP trafficking subunit Trs65-domain-containing protein [Xylariomycetidae sp. FL0641]|nr:TRAPP trafficking subunit Trs65-domain-containing protein [Xylariomycetidae sp. FL0641]
MDPDHQDSDSRPGLDFVDNSSLAYFIPLHTDFELGALFDGVDGSYQTFVDSIERRESLLFDETVDVVLVLRTPYAEENTIKSSLRRLVISLEAQIVNGNTPDPDSSPAAQTIHSDTLEDAGDPLVLLDKQPAEDAVEGGGADRFAYAVWKLPVTLSRPRMRLHSPSAVFSAVASLKPADVSLSSGLRDGYLPSGVASGLNLLESFANDPAMNGVKPRLSALRVSRVAPITRQAKDLLRPIQSLSTLAVRIFPAIHSRIRFTHPNTAPPTAAMIAMLEVDFTPFIECEVMLDKVSLSLTNGTSDDLTKQTGMSLPMSCVAYDHVTFLFRLAPGETDFATRNPMRDLDIAISATALVRPGICKPRLQLGWSTTCDFTMPVNPGYGSTMQPIQRSHRPSQLSISGENSISLVAPAVARPDALPSLEASTRDQSETQVQDLGVTMTFTAPSSSQKIYLGDQFAWTVFVVNRAPNPLAAPRKLAMIAIPKRRRNDLRVNRAPSVSRASEALYRHSISKGITDGDVADAVLEDNVVHAMQRSSVVDTAEVACLSADVRIGPLVPGACHVAELRFLALKEGVVSVEAVRIIDLVNNEHVDIRELPTVVVEARPET